MIVSLIILPLLMALITLFVSNSKGAGYLALFAGLVELGIVVFMLSNFVPDSSVQYVVDCAWIPDLGVRFNLGVDGIGMSLVLLTASLLPLIIVSSLKREYGNANHLYALVLLMQSGLMLVFTALDAFLFYVGWEVALIPIYFICAIWGGENRIRVNLKFFIYTIFGSLFMLLAIIYLHTHTSDASFQWRSFVNTNLSIREQSMLFWLFFIAFAIKIPIFPFHTWQPDTYTEAPAIGTMLLSGIMLKMGLYGVLRWILPVLPMGVLLWGNLAMILSIIGVVYASLIAFTQKDAKRLLAYSSMAHVGLIAAGIFSLNSQGVQGAIIQMLTHGLGAVALFFVIDIIERNTGSRMIDQMGGIAKKAPNFAITFLIVLLGAIALPLTSGFVGEFMLLIGISQQQFWMVILAGLSVIFGAVYMLRMYQSLMLGNEGFKVASFADISGSDLVLLALMSFFTIAIGVYPEPLLSISEDAVQQLILEVTHKMGIIK